MSTCAWIERVALAIDSDWTPEVQAHAFTCAECRELLRDQELLRELPPVPETALAEVRNRVLTRVASRRAWPWRTAAGLLLAAAGLSWWSWRLPDVEPLQTRISAPAAPEIAPVVARRAERNRMRRRTAVNRAPELAMGLRELLGPQNAAPASARVPILVTVQTEDPDVVIVLLSDSKGD